MRKSTILDANALVSFNWNVNHILLIELLVVEELPYGKGDGRLLYFFEFLFEVASFQVENAVWQIVESGLFDFLAHPIHEFGKLSDCPSDDEVELLWDFVCSNLFSGYVVEAELVDAVYYYFDFFPNRIDQVESAVGEEDGKRKSWESPSGADVHDAGAGLERHCFGNGERVKNVPFRQVGDVSAGDKIDLLVPFADQIGELGEAVVLKRREIREMSFYDSKVEIHAAFSVAMPDTKRKQKSTMPKT